MTQYHTVHIRFTADEGAMLRILGLIHRRGFEVTAIDMPQSDEEGMRTATLSMEPKGAGFRVEILQKQLMRLLEVKEVRLSAPMKRKNILSFFGLHPTPKARQTTGVR